MNQLNALSNRVEYYAQTLNGKEKKGYHQVEYDVFGPVTEWDPTGPDDMCPHCDFPFAYSRDMTGRFKHLNEFIFAHEVGHAMGLGDDYFQGGGVKPEAGGIDHDAGVEFYDSEDNPVFSGSFMSAGARGWLEPVHLARIINMMKEAGVLPSCDFYGTFRYMTSPASPVKTRASADIVLNHDGRGNLTGTMVGQHEIIPGIVGPCSIQPTQSGRFRVSLVGSYTKGRSLKVFVEDVVDEMRPKYHSRCSGVSLPVTEYPGFKAAIWGIKEFLGTPSDLGEGEGLPDGTREYKVGTFTVTLRRTRN